MRKRELPKQVRIMSRVNKQQSDSDRQVIRGEASFTIRLGWTPFRTREIVRPHQCIWPLQKPVTIYYPTNHCLGTITKHHQLGAVRCASAPEACFLSFGPSPIDHSQRVDTLPHVAVPPIHGVDPLPHMAVPPIHGTGLLSTAYPRRSDQSRTIIACRHNTISCDKVVSGFFRSENVTMFASLFLRA